MRKSSALAFSFQFTKEKNNKLKITTKQNKKHRTKPMHLFYTGKKQRMHTLLILDTISCSHYETVLKQRGVLRDVKAQRRKGRGKKTGYFQTTWSQLHYCYLNYHSNMEPAMVLPKTYSFKDLSRPHSGDKD